MPFLIFYYQQFIFLVVDIDGEGNLNVYGDFEA